MEVHSSPASPLGAARTYTGAATTAVDTVAKMARPYESVQSLPLQQERPQQPIVIGERVGERVGDRDDRVGDRQKLPLRPGSEQQTRFGPEQQTRFGPSSTTSQSQQQYAATHYSTTYTPQPMSQIPPRPTQSTAGSVVTGGIPLRGPMLAQSPGPMTITTTSTSDMRLARSRAEDAVGRLAALQRQYQQHLQYGSGAANVPGSTAAAVQAELRAQTGIALSQLRDVRRAVAAAALSAESHRFRRWLIGGFLATFIPLVRRLFRRRSSRTSSSNVSGVLGVSTMTATAGAAGAAAGLGGLGGAAVKQVTNFRPDPYYGYGRYGPYGQFTQYTGQYTQYSQYAQQAQRLAVPATAATAAAAAAPLAAAAVNDTEYAFARSRALVDRMLQSVRGGGGRLASLAFFVFAVLYVFTNEVTLRVARTVGRRLKRLSVKMERGDEPLDEADLRQLTGWRWRVLLWGRK